MFGLLDSYGHEQVAFCRDADTGLRAIVAIHDTTLGPALGGIRMLPYESEDDALRDVLELSRGMTYKAAIAGVPLGGGKSVIIGNPQTDKSAALLRAMGRFIQGLGGRYIPGIDSGTTQEDLRVVARETDHVSCIGHDPSPFTALGVYAGIRAGLFRNRGSDEPRGSRIAIQGVGHVGEELARLLARDGAELVLSDVHGDVVRVVAKDLNARVVEPDEIAGIACDVFAPCALGGAINDDSLGVLDAGAVVGAANNVLAESRHGVELHRRGIRYAPDYCANGGGIIFLVEEMAGHNRSTAENRVRGIGDTLHGIWTRSQRENVPPEAIANEIARKRIADNRRQTRPIRDVPDRC